MSMIRSLRSVQFSSYISTIATIVLEMCFVALLLFEDLSQKQTGLYKRALGVLCCVSVSVNAT